MHERHLLGVRSQTVASDENREWSNTTNVETTQENRKCATRKDLVDVKLGNGHIGRSSKRRQSHHNHSADQNTTLMVREQKHLGSLSKGSLLFFATKHSLHGHFQASKKSSKRAIAKTAGDL